MTYPAIHRRGDDSQPSRRRDATRSGQGENHRDSRRETRPSGVAANSTAFRPARSASDQDGTHCPWLHPAPATNVHGPSRGSTAGAGLADTPKPKPAHTGAAGPDDRGHHTHRHRRRVLPRGSRCRNHHHRRDRRNQVRGAAASFTGPPGPGPAEPRNPVADRPARPPAQCLRSSHRRPGPTGCLSRGMRMVPRPAGLAFRAT